MTRKILAASAALLIVCASAGCTGGAKHGGSACGLTPGSVTPPQATSDPTTEVENVGGLPALGPQYAQANEAVRMFPVADVGAYYVTDRGVGLLTTAGKVTWSLRGKVTSAVAADRSFVVQTGQAIAAIGLASGVVITCVKDGSDLTSATRMYLDPREIGLPVDGDRMSRLSPIGGDDQHTTVVQQLDLPETGDDTASSVTDFAAIGGAFGSWELAGAVHGFAVLGGYQTPAGEGADAYVQFAFVGRSEFSEGSGPGPDVSKSGSGADVDVVRLTAPVRAAPAGYTWIGEKVRGVSASATVVLQDVYVNHDGATRYGAIAAYSSRGTRLWTASGAQDVAMSDGGVMGVSVAYGALELTEWNEESGKVTGREKLAAHTDPAQPLQLLGQSSQVWVLNGQAIAYVFTGDGKLGQSDSFKVPSDAQLVHFELGEGSSAAAITIEYGQHRSISLIDGP